MEGKEKRIKKKKKKNEVFQNTIASFTNVNT